MNEVNGSGGGSVRRRDGWHGDVGRKPRQGVNDAFSRGLGDPDLVSNGSGKWQGQGTNRQQHVEPKCCVQWAFHE
jgi:hypothetical protein